MNYRRFIFLRIVIIALGITFSTRLKKYLLSGILFLSTFISLSFSQNISIDTSTKFQTINRWENGLFLPPGLAPYVIDDLVDLTIDTLGINRVRLEVRSGSENPVDYYQQYMDSLVDYATWRTNRYATINDNDDPQLINWEGFHFTELRSRIEEVLIPLRNRSSEKGSSMYVNLCFVAFTGQLNNGNGGSIIQQIPDEYAEFMEAIFLFMDSNYSFVPDGIEIILEPDVAKFGDGTLVAQCMIAAGQRLKSIGYEPDFIGPSNTNLFNALGKTYDKFTAVEGFSDFWSEYSFHSYAGRADSNLIQIGANAHSHGVESSMLEWWTSGHTFEYLHKCLKLANVSSYEYKGSFGAVDNEPTDGLLSISDDGNDNYSLDLQSRVKYFRHYFKLIQPGAQRLETLSDSADFDPVLFKNPDGNLVLNIMVNKGATLNITGLPAGNYGVIYSTGNGRTNPSNYWVKMPIVEHNGGADFKAEMPAKGILSIVQRDNLETKTDPDPKVDKSIPKIYSRGKSILIENLDPWKTYDFEILDLNKHLLLQKRVNGQQKIQLTLASWPSGIYIILVNHSQAEKVFIN